MAAPLLLLLLLAALVPGWALSARAVAAAPGGLAGRPAVVARTTRRWRAAGVGGGLVAGVLTGSAGGLGLGLLLAAPVAALCVLAGVVAGELRVPAPSGPLRSAALGTRHARDVVPRGLGRVVAGTSALLAVLLAATTAVGSPDDLGRAGRSLLRQCSAVQSTAVGPWPGSYYTVPVAVTVGVGLLLAGWALRRVARRPLDATDAAVDGALRRTSATAVAAAAGLLVAAPAAAVSVVAAAALAGVDCAPAGWSALALLLALVAVAGTGLSAWTAGVLLRSTVPAAAPGEPVVR